MHYSLRIRTDSSNYCTVSDILGVEVFDFSKGWVYEVVTIDNKYFDFINEFLNMLDGKYEFLSKIGVSKNDISIWMIYEYEEQCNLEFLPKDLKRLGENDISLCISCFGAGV